MSGRQGSALGPFVAAYYTHPSTTPLDACGVSFSAPRAPQPSPPNIDDGSAPQHINIWHHHSPTISPQNSPQINRLFS